MITSRRKNWQPYFAETVSQLLAMHTFRKNISQQYFAAKTVEGVTGVNVLNLLQGRVSDTLSGVSMAEMIANAVGMSRLEHGSSASRGDLILFERGDTTHLGVCLGIKGVAVVEGDVIYTHMAEVSAVFTYA